MSSAANPTPPLVVPPSGGPLLGARTPSSASPSSKQSAPSSPDSQLTTHNSQPSSPIPNPHSIASAAYSLITQRLISGHGALITTAPLPDDALTRQAVHGRLSLIAARLELILLEKVDRLAVRGLLTDDDTKNFDRVLYFLTRLTAIQKSLDAYLQNDPDAPDSSTLQSDLNSALSDYLEAQTPSPASPSAGQPAPPSPNPGTADGPVRNASAGQPASPSPNPGTADGPVRNASPVQPAPPSPNNPQSAIHNPQSSPVHAVHAVHSVHSVHAVPSCPTLPFDAIEPALVQIHTALLGARTPSSAPLSVVQPAAPSPNSQPPFPISQPFDLHSAIDNLIASSRCPRACDFPACYECDQPFCPERLVLALDHITCQGGCASCPAVPSCPFAPARFRSPP